MHGKHLEIDLPDELWKGLARVAAALGISSPAEAALIAVADWVSRRKTELDNSDPNERYFVNEALDALASGQAPRK